MHSLARLDVRAFVSVHVTCLQAILFQTTVSAGPVEHERGDDGDFVALPANGNLSF